MSSAELAETINSIFHWYKRGIIYKLEPYSVISNITSTDPEFLNGMDLERAPVSKKMSWAAHRMTSRFEDIAYCLLAIYDVNMPLIYGEGNKALRRLQQEHMNAYPQDRTLYAWGELVERSSLQNPAPRPRWKEQHHHRNGPASAKNLYDLLAESPKDFEHSGAFVPSTAPLHHN
ncbi:hypothetical protein BX600DRAFT_443862 [Xylariales sp. PMI_506]|nr:hypothetical protein BX600DRAFT_443862 [Xylariales sp. PMI_506]